MQANERNNSYYSATLSEVHLCVSVQHQACSHFLQNRAFSSLRYNRSGCWQQRASFHFFECEIQSVETFFFFGNSSENGFSLHSASKCLRGDWNSESGLTALVPLATLGSFSLCEGKGGDNSRGKNDIIKNLTQGFHWAPFLSLLLFLWKAGGENSMILFT